MLTPPTAKDGHDVTITVDAISLLPVFPVVVEVVLPSEVAKVESNRQPSLLMDIQ